MAQNLPFSAVDMTDPSMWVTTTDNTSGKMLMSNGAANPTWVAATNPHVMTDNRPTVVEKPLAIQVELEAWKIQDTNFDLITQTVVEASRKLMHACQADTRCGGCVRLTYKHEQIQDHMRDSTRIRLTTQCKTTQTPNVTVVLCPDGRTTSRHGGGATQMLEPIDLEKAVLLHAPSEKKVSVNPDVPKTAMDESW